MTSKTFVDRETIIDADWLNDVDRLAYGPATKTIAKTLTPVDGAKIYPQGSDGGVFIGGTGKAVGYYDDNGGTAYGTRFKPTGGDGTAGWERATNWGDVQANGNRSAIRYFNTVKVFVTDKNFTMNEFRVAGQYTRPRAPTWTTTNDTTEIAIDADTFGSQAKKLNNWYGAFVCADAGDATVSTQAVPFLRARSVAGSVITLGNARIGDDELAGLLPAETYTWTPAELVGVKCLVISEGVLSGKVNVLGSRITTITAATTTTVTLDDIGSIGARDWILPAPTGFNFFKYLGAFYVDSSAVTNISDTGSIVRYLGVANANFTNNYTGSQATAVTIKLGGYISPLATSAILETKYSITGAATGDSFEFFGSDVSHFFDTRVHGKEGTSNQSIRNNYIVLPFLWRQEYAYKNSGGVIATKSFDEHYPYGWIEE